MLTQNDTFTANATVDCVGGACGTVNLSIRYNRTTDADTLLPNGSGKPFHTTVRNLRRCGTDIRAGDRCFATWTPNATGTIGSTHLLDANASSNLSQVDRNESKDVTVDITRGGVVLSLKWTNISFITSGLEEDAPAIGNDAQLYNITVEEESVDVDDLWIKGVSPTSNGFFLSNYTVNYSYSTTNDPTTETLVTEQYQHITSNVPAGTNVTTYYWTDIRSTAAGNYNGTVTYKGNATLN